MIIRHVTIDDAPALREYAARLFSEDLPGIFRRRVPTLDEERAFIRERLEPASSTLLMAEVNGAPIGLVDLVGGSLEEERHVGTFGISVDHDWRGRGVGTALIEALLEWAAANGITRVQAFAWATNPRALALYERLGFEREGVCRKAVVRDGVPVDVVLIARLLDEVAE